MRGNIKLMLLSVLFLLTPAATIAGSLDSPAAPTTAAGGALNTLEDVYNIINDGTTSAPRTGTFAEPSATPASTGHTLTEVYNRAKTSSRPAETGQTTSYRTHDDGDLEKGVTWPSPRFTDNGNGTVTDNLTGLIWLKNANCFNTRSWTNALSDCNGLANGSCGLSDSSSAGDWRLPNFNELLSLIDSAYYTPALSNDAGTAKWSADEEFTNVQSDKYWTGTTYASSTGSAWFVHFDTGYVYFGKKGDCSNYVWPVKGGQ